VTTIGELDARRTRPLPQGHGRGRRIGRLLFGLMFILGAMTHVILILSGASYSGFADGSSIPFVREKWDSLFVTHVPIFASLLAAFELTVGFLILAGGARTRMGLIAAIGFTGALVLFGWGFLIWSLPVGSLLVWQLVSETRGGGSN
jgi:hypothetical protein